MMRHLSLSALIVSALLLGSLAFGTGVAHASRVMRLGGEPDDNFWQVDYRYCRDGIVMAAKQQSLSTDFANFGANGARFSLQLTAADPPVNVILPYPIVQGDGSAMVNRTVGFLFASDQLPGTPVRITVERWDHGHDSAVEVDDVNSDHSPSDDVVTDNGGVVEDCRIIALTATPTATETATATPTNTATATATNTATSTPTSTSVPTAVPSNTPSPTVTATSSPSATPSPTITGNRTLVARLAVVKPSTPRLLAAQVHASPSRGGGHGHYDEALKLFVPAGVLREDAALYLEVPPASQLPARLRDKSADRSRVGVGFVFIIAQGSVRGNDTAPLISQRAVLLQVQYDPAQLQGVDPRTLRIATIDPFANAWQDLPTTVDTYHHMVTARAREFTFLQLRGIAPTPARFAAATAFLATLATAAPRIDTQATTQHAVGGLPFDLALPSGRQQGPLTLTATGAPGAHLRAAFTLAGATITQTMDLDAQGFAATSFAPPAGLRGPQRLSVAVSVSLHSSRYSVAGMVTLLPGAAGPLPPGAPPLWATLDAPVVRAGVDHPSLQVRTAPGLMVRVAPAKAGQAASMGTADSNGVLRLRLPPIPRALLVGKRSQIVPVVVTVTRRGQTSAQTLTLTLRA